MFDRFQNKYKQLEQDFAGVELFMKRTISSIIVISKEEIVTKYGLEPVSYVSRDDIMIPLICRYVSDTLQCYVMEIIRCIFNRISEVLDDYSAENSEEASFKLFSFTVNDLLRCKCTGTRDQVLSVWSKLNALAKTEDITIITVKNRLSSHTKDILITYKIRQSFLLCEIQLALSSVNEEVNDHFNHFLYEQHRSRYGIVCELAMMVNTHDPRNKYFENNQLSFKSLAKTFSVNGPSIFCIEDPKEELDYDKKDIPYICRQCCRFIDAFRFYMLPMKCNLCFKKICPMCYLALLPAEDAIGVAADPIPVLLSYFQPIGRPYTDLSASKLEEIVLSEIRNDSEDQVNYLAVLSYKSNINDWDVRLIRTYAEEIVTDLTKTKNIFLEAFSYREINISEFSKSIVLLLKPTAPLERWSKEKLIEMSKNKASYPFENMYGLQKDYNLAELTEAGVFVAKSENKMKAGAHKVMMVDYILNQEEAYDRISNQRLQKIVNTENSKSSGVLVLNDLSLNFEMLDKIKNPGSIFSMEIANGYRL